MGKFQIISGVQETAKKVVLYGTEGIGKTTFATNFPDPLFIDTEASTTEMDVKRLPKPTSWQMLKDEVVEVINERPCKTLIIDTADWAEKLCVQSVCASHGKMGIEEFGYGTGYTYVAEEWAKFLDLLQDVIDVAKINVVLTAHAIIRKFEQPNEMGAYDRYELKLGKKTTGQTAPITKEWADMVLFANYKTLVVASDDKGKKFKGQGGLRVMYTTHHPCWDAKNRYGLKEELPLDYEHIRHIFDQQPVSQSHAQPVQPPQQEPAPSPVVSTPVTPQLDIAEGAQSGPQIYDVPPVPTPSPAADEGCWDGIPQALVDLMKQNKVTPKQIQRVVAFKKYYPEDMPIKDYDPGFIQGVLIGAWQQVLNEVVLPF